MKVFIKPIKYFTFKKKMKNLFLILLSTASLSLYSHIDYSLPTTKTYNVNVKEEKNVTIKTEKSLSEKIADSQRAAAERAKAAAAIAAAMTPANTTTITDFQRDLNDFTSIALVDINSFQGRKKKTYYVYSERLSGSIFDIINPTIDKKKFKNNPLYLKNEKNEDWLYLYYTRKKEGINVVTTVLLRDYENNVVYSAKHINVGIPEILFPITSY